MWRKNARVPGRENAYNPLTSLAVLVFAAPIHVEWKSRATYIHRSLRTLSVTATEEVRYELAGVSASASADPFVALHSVYTTIVTGLVHQSLAHP